MTAEQYFKQMAQEAGLDEATTSALIGIANNEKLSPKLSSLVKTFTEDYPAQLGRAKAAEAKKLEYDNWYAANKPIADQAIQRAAELESELARIRAGGDPPQFDASKYLTKDDLIQYNKDLAIRLSGTIVDTNDITARHVSRFGEPPDLKAIGKLADEQNLPLSAAYDRWIAPRVEERQKEAFKKEKEEFAQQAVKDALSRHHLPVDPVPTDTAPVYAPRPKEGSTPIDMDAELMAAWNGAAKSS